MVIKQRQKKITGSNTQLALAKLFFLTGMLTRDLFALANLLVSILYLSVSVCDGFTGNLRLK